MLSAKITSLFEHEVQQQLLGWWWGGGGSLYAVIFVLDSPERKRDPSIHF